MPVTLTNDPGSFRHGQPLEFRPNIDRHYGLIRLIDIVCALFAIAFFAPIMLLIVAAVVIADPGPVIFAHRRIGLARVPFSCFKFRTMAVDAEARLQHLLATDPIARAEWNRDHKLRSDPRIVGIGNFLRKSSLDELPQLFNVIRGDMSLVGPRPIVEAETLRYGRYMVDYCAVRPGITGLWQIGGRNNTTYRRRVAYDVVYRRNQSALLNLKILILTIPSVLRRSGSY